MASVLRAHRVGRRGRTARTCPYVSTHCNIAIEYCAMLPSAAAQVRGVRSWRRRAPVPAQMWARGRAYRRGCATERTAWRVRPTAHRKTCAILVQYVNKQNDKFPTEASAFGGHSRARTVAHRPTAAHTARGLFGSNHCGGTHRWRRRRWPTGPPPVLRCRTPPASSHVTCGIDSLTGTRSSWCSTRASRTTTAEMSAVRDVRSSRNEYTSIRP
jgi:hypothetical protein